MRETELHNSLMFTQWSTTVALKTFDGEGGRKKERKEDDEVKEKKKSAFYPQFLSRDDTSVWNMPPFFRLLEAQRSLLLSHFDRRRRRRICARLDAEPVVIVVLAGVGAVATILSASRTKGPRLPLALAHRDRKSVV